MQHLTRSCITAVAAALAVMAWGNPARADIIVRPTSATASSYYPDSSSTNVPNTDDSVYPPVSLFNGDGFTAAEADQLETGDPVPTPPDTWATDDNTKSSVYLSESGDDEPTVTFNLGQSYLLTGLHLWNYNQPTHQDRGFKDVTITFSLDDSTYFGNETFTFTIAPGTTTYEGNDYAFTTPVTAQWVRIDATSNWGGSYGGLSGIRFTAVPEPASLALLGLGGVMLLGRRRR